MPELNLSSCGGMESLVNSEGRILREGPKQETPAFGLGANGLQVLVVPSLF
jgi:hypothetical protein